MAKYISDEALKEQQKFAHTLKDYIWDAAKLADDTVETMVNFLSSHFRRDDDRARSVPAHQYWLAYFWYTISTDEKIGAGFGYDLRQWNEDSGNSSIPPWRVYLYLHPTAANDPKLIQKIHADYKKKGWLEDDCFVSGLPTEKSNINTSLWLPVPKAFVGGFDQKTYQHPDVPFLLAGAVNAFLGNIMP